MIYVRLAGGLGNQLFQLACALHVRLPGEKVLLATNGLDAYKAARQPDVESIIDLARLGVACGRLKSPILAGLMAARIPRLIRAAGLTDRNFDSGNVAHRSARRHLLLDGYFQANWQWNDFRHQASALAAAVRLPEQRRSLGDTCAIHVRGTDFLVSIDHQLIDAGYYTRAFAALRAVSNVKSVIVVTDDPAYASAMLQELRDIHTDVRFDIPEQRGSIVTDFANMRDADSRVIPNSTFSWWGAALDAHRGPTISPDRFTRRALRHLSLPWEATIAPAMHSSPR